MLRELMRALLLFCALTRATSWSLAVPARGSCALLQRHRAVRLQEAEPEATSEVEASPPPAAAAASYTSPLAGLTGDEKLKEMQAMKEEANAKRNSLRAKINVGLPAVIAIFLVLAQLAGGKEALQGFGDGDLLGSAPGMEEARAMKAGYKVKTQENIDALQKAVTGN